MDDATMYRNALADTAELATNDKELRWFDLERTTLRSRCLTNPSQLRPARRVACPADDVVSIRLVRDLPGYESY